MQVAMGSPPYGRFTTQLKYGKGYLPPYGQATMKLSTLTTAPHLMGGLQHNQTCERPIPALCGGWERQAKLQQNM